MIFVNKFKFHNITSLYDFFNDNMEVLDISIDPLSIKKIKNKDDIFFFIDPSISELKLMLDLDKEVIVMLTYVYEDYLDLLKSNLVKQVIVVDDLDALFFQKRNFKKFVCIAPFDINTEFIQKKDYKEMTHSCVCYDDLSKLTEGDINIMSSLPNYKVKIIYSGFKVITKKNDFYNLKAINDSNVVFKNFPIFDPLREINIVLYTLSFTKNEFPIVAAITAAHKNIPLIFSQRYYSWILTEFQIPSKETMKILSNIKNRRSLRMKQFELFMKSFKDRPNIKEVLSEYDKSDGEIQISSN